MQRAQHSPARQSLDSAGGESDYQFRRPPHWTPWQHAEGPGRRGWFGLVFNQPIFLGEQKAREGVSGDIMGKISINICEQNSNI